MDLVKLTFAKDKQKRVLREKAHDYLIKKIDNTFNETRLKITNKGILSRLETIVDHTKNLIIRNREVDILKNKELIDLCNYVITLIEIIEDMPDYPISEYADKILTKIFSLDKEFEPKKIDNNNNTVYFPKELESFLQEDSDYFKNLPKNQHNTHKKIDILGANVKPKMFAKFYKDFSKLKNNYFPSGKSTKERSPEEIDLYNTMQDALSYTKDLYRYLNDKGYIHHSGNLIDIPNKMLNAKIQKNKERLYEPLKALYTALDLQIDPFSFYK